MKKDTFANRLNKAMELNNYKQIDLVNKTKIDKTLINKYLNGVSEAGNDKLSILGKALNVNEVWLMGYDVPMSSEHEKKTNFSLSLYELLRYYQLNTETLSSQINIDKKRLDDFINQSCLPNKKELNTIVNYFNLEDDAELFDGRTIQKIISNYQINGEKITDKYKFGLEFESMLISLSLELNLKLEDVKSIVFNRKKDLTLLVTYDDLYNFLKRIVTEKTKKD